MSYCSTCFNLIQKLLNSGRLAVLELLSHIVMMDCIEDFGGSSPVKFHFLFSKFPNLTAPP